MKKHISELTPKEIEEFNQSIASASAQYDVEQAFAEAIKRTIDNVYAVDISEKTARSMAALSASATPSGITKFSSKMKQLQEEANREAIRKRKVDNALVRLAKRHAAELTTVAQRNRFIRTYMKKHPKDFDGLADALDANDFRPSRDSGFQTFGDWVAASKRNPSLRRLFRQMTYDART